MLTGSVVFEMELKKCLQYATIWQAVVLLDEADVFLEARTDNSSNRNALVASEATPPFLPLFSLPFSRSAPNHMQSL
jgi:hypothetical protein